MSRVIHRRPNCICKSCKKPIYKRPSQIKVNHGNVYCSSRCYGIGLRKLVSCAVCGKQMLTGENKKTCSRSCSNINRAGIIYKRNSPFDKFKHYRSLKVKLLEIFGKSCSRCGYSKFEILQIHHIDRNRLNNKLENIEMICPNCHYEEHYLEKSWLKKIHISER